MECRYRRFNSPFFFFLKYKLCLKFNNIREKNREECSDNIEEIFRMILSQKFDGIGRTMTMTTRQCPVVYSCLSHFYLLILLTCSITQGIKLIVSIRMSWMMMMMKMMNLGQICSVCNAKFYHSDPQMSINDRALSCVNQSDFPIIE